jgi:replicative DNA helicase
MEININEVIVNTGSERAVLASCLNNPNAIIEMEAEGLTPKHFAVEAHKIIYSCIVYLFTKNAQIDAISIMNTIKDEKAKKVIEDIGGLEYILILQQSPTSSNTHLFVQNVMQAYTRRNMYRTCAELQDVVIKADNMDSNELLGIMSQRVTDLTLDHSKVADAYKFGDSLGERLQRIAENPNEVPGLPTGWKRFDKITNGLEPNDLVIIVAESKTGKSVTLLNWAKHVAIDLGLPALYIDTEQSEEEQEFRLLSILTQIPEIELKTGLFMQDSAYGTAKDKIASIQKAKKQMQESNLYHVFMPDFTLEKIQAVTRQFHLKHGIVALFFDYINFNPTLMAQNRNLRDDMILTNLAIGLKDIAGILKIPVVTAAQENRTGYGSTEKDAKNIGGSIGILQKATKLCFLRNKTDEELVTQGGKGNQKFLIRYQRHGSTDQEIDIMFDKIRITQKEVS